MKEIDNGTQAEKAAWRLKLELVVMKSPSSKPWWWVLAVAVAVLFIKLNGVSVG